MNLAVFLAVSAGVAIALQVVVNSVGMRDLGLGALIGISGATTALAGLAWALFAARAEATGRALLCALASGILGVFILGSIVLAARGAGLAQTLSLVIASQLVIGLAIDRLGVFGPMNVGFLKVLGVLLILVGGLSARWLRQLVSISARSGLIEASACQHFS
jgi:transporter family-2 protein